MEKFKLIDHEKKCGNIEIKCEKCGKKIIRMNEKNHIENECEESFIQCAECYKKIKRKEMKNHNKTECLENQVLYWKFNSIEKNNTIMQLEKKVSDLNFDLQVSQRNLNRNISYSNFNNFKNKYNTNTINSYNTVNNSFINNNNNNNGNNKNINNSNKKDSKSGILYWRTMKKINFYQNQNSENNKKNEE
jgi:hypothetical protein